MADDAVAEAIQQAREAVASYWYDRAKGFCWTAQQNLEMSLLKTLADEVERLRAGWADLQAAVLNLARQRDDFDAERRIAVAERDAAIEALRPFGGCITEPMQEPPDPKCCRYCRARALVAKYG